MKEDQFKKMDESISQKIKEFPAREVPERILKHFSVSIAEKIRERENARILARGRMPAFGLRVFVPVFAAFLLFFTVVFHGPSSMSLTCPALPFLSATTSEMADEVTTLKAVGAWNDEDDKAMMPEENSLEEMA